ncbi:MAG: hypothetical protein WBZ29_16485 [Methanocella sp.]
MKQFKKVLLATALLLALLVVSTGVSAQIAPCGPLVQTGGFTRTVSASAVGGTFVPPQAQVSDTFYSYPGISPFGPYPGAGYASTEGIGFTPYGYMPYGGFTYL